MEYDVRASTQASKDLTIAQCHYRASNIEDAFNIDFKTQIGYIKSNPYLFQIYYRNVRKVHLSSFKYSIHYVIKNKTVYILRILGQNQKI